DNISQSAISFMARLDEAFEFKDKAVHESAMVALLSLLGAQFINGAFPQVWTSPVPKFPITKASYPDYDYRIEGKVKDYWNMYTPNEGLAGTVSDALIAADAFYNSPSGTIFQIRGYHLALKKLGVFLILAQIPDPQPAWAQQYSRDMQPIWARRFE